MFGGWLTVLAIASVSGRSRAAGPGGAPGGGAVAPGAEGSARQLLPLQGKAPVALLDSPGRPDAAPPALTVEACPADMVEVEGNYCPLVEQKCTRWLDPATKLQCAEFERVASPSHCSMRTERKHFCIDRYEWPNRAGELPRSMASWVEAKATCEGIGKRLCGDTEWTLACEGPEHHPYPYGDGYARDDAVCNVDKPYIWPHPERVYNPETSVQELARLDQREPSGARASCVSPYGVHDMAGNVDEWVVNVSQFGQPHVSGLKGGYWGPVRTRCRPMTTGHEQTFRYYQTGFRCCEDAGGSSGVAPIAAR